MTDLSTSGVSSTQPIGYVRLLASYDRDALIKIELDSITPQNIDDEALTVANVQFNNLDIVGL